MYSGISKHAYPFRRGRYRIIDENKILLGLGGSKQDKVREHFYCVFYILSSPPFLFKTIESRHDILLLSQARYLMTKVIIALVILCARHKFFLTLLVSKLRPKVFFLGVVLVEVTPSHQVNVKSSFIILLQNPRPFSF